MQPDATTEHSRVDSFLEVAAALFREQGFEGTSIRDLATGMKITSSTMYHYFENKQEILFRINERIMLRFNDQLLTVAALPGTPDERLRRTMLAQVIFQGEPRNAVLTSSRFQRVMSVEQRAVITGLQRKYREAVREILVEGKSTGVFDIEDIDTVATAILDMVSSVQEWYKPSGRLSIEKVAEIYAEAALRVCGAGRSELVAQSAPSTEAC